MIQTIYYIHINYVVQSLPFVIIREKTNCDHEKRNCFITSTEKLSEEFLNSFEGFPMALILNLTSKTSSVVTIREHYF